MERKKWPKKKGFLLLQQGKTCLLILLQLLCACALNRNHLFGINLLDSVRQLSSTFLSVDVASFSILYLFCLILVSNLSLFFLGKLQYNSSSSSFRFQLWPTEGIEEKRNDKSCLELQIAFADLSGIRLMHADREESRHQQQLRIARSECKRFNSIWICDRTRLLPLFYDLGLVDLPQLLLPSTPFPVGN